MNLNDLIKILRKIRIGAEYIAYSDENNEIKLEWVDEKQVEPTKEELLAEYEILKVEELKKEYYLKIDNIINNKAKELKYDDINSISKYIYFENKYQSECLKLAKWCSDIWLKVEELEKQFEETKEFKTFEEILEVLPKYENY